MKTLDVMKGYKAKLISTIVDSAVKEDVKQGYKAKLISTIVDLVISKCLYGGYKAKLISTIVDRGIWLNATKAIKPN